MQQSCKIFTFYCIFSDGTSLVSTGKFSDNPSSMKSNINQTKMSRLVRKPTICICENKGADQLRSKCEADQRLCFRYTDSTIPLLPKFQVSSHLLRLYSPDCVGPVRKPHCWFPHETAQIELLRTDRSYVDNLKIAH